MQRKSSARQKAVSDVQRGAAQPAGRVAREVKAAPPPPSSPSSSETTLGGHVDRGLTLAALYDLGVLERLRLEVRLRLLSDMAQSLAWLHANPRLMASHPYLVIAPSTMVIGLDGVARVDVRAAKRHSERNPTELDYMAPELFPELPPSGRDGADRRADIYSLGVIAWEALTGQRLGGGESWQGLGDSAGGTPSELPAALGGKPDRDPLRRRAQPVPAPKPSHSRLRVPPPITLPEGGDWAGALAELVLQAMCPDPEGRLADCRPLIHELEQIAEHLAPTYEIAEVVQGISGVQTLCVPPPTLPDVDAACQSEASGRLGFMDRQACVSPLAPTCAQRQVVTPRRVVEVPQAPAPASEASPAPSAAAPVLTTARRGELGGLSSRGWIVAGLLWLAVLGLVAGFAASWLAVR